MGYTIPKLLIQKTSMVKQLWRDVWQALNTPISWEGAVKGSVDSLKTIAELAKAIQENKSAQELAPLVTHFSSLLDVLSSPLGQVATAGLGGWLLPGARYLVGSPPPRVEHRPLVLRGVPVRTGSDPMVGGIAQRRHAQRCGSP